MWLWYFLLGSGSGSVDCQLLPEHNFTDECSIPGAFVCGDGKCVPGVKQCDGFLDCLDWSDEKSCLRTRSRCAPTFFACANGVHCIIGRFQCNGFRDCPDGSDEDNCIGNPMLCSSARFICGNGRCIDHSFLCNGEDNCQDNSDEENCLSTADSPAQDSEIPDIVVCYFPNMSYTVVVGALVFVLVVALLALVVYHQRKRGMLLPQGVYGSCQRPLLLSLIVERGPSSGTQTQPPTLDLADADPPPYAQAMLDPRRPVWFDLPPPPYPRPEGDPPVYEEQQTNTQDQHVSSSSRTDPD